MNYCLNKFSFATKILFLTILCCFPRLVNAQAVSIQGGISQPLALEGYNIAATYYGEKFLIGYSHGGNLRFDANGGVALNDAEKRQNLGVFLPYTTGLSLGYLIRKNLDIRIEFKEHYYRVKSATGLDELALFDSLGLRSDLPINEATGLWLPGANGRSFVETTIEKAALAKLLYNADYVPSNRRARYRTRSVGLGLYYRYFPLGGEEGLMLEPSIRYWPNVWTDGRERYALENQFGQLGLHRAHDQGVFVNVSLGYYKQL